MTMPRKSPSHSINFNSVSHSHLLATIIGRMDFDTSAAIISAISKQISGGKLQQIDLDLSDVTYFDDYGALIVDEITQIANRHKTQITLRDPNHVADAILAFFDFKSLKKEPEAKKSNLKDLVVQVGKTAIDDVRTAGNIISFLGAVILAFLRVMAHPKSFRFEDAILTMENTGVKAVPIVSLISFLLGLVIAFMSSLQLKQFGANIYVASLVSIGMVSELGPIMTAIVVAGRSGSAFAAEIGTMKISEEIDALTTMGFDPVVFLGVPRIFAAICVIPILTLVSNIFAILGGLFVGVTLLNLTTSSYIKESLAVLDLFEVSWGFMKSIVFAVIISMVGCLRGFEAKGGADAVGNAATSAVVTSIFLIILFDSFFAVLRSFWW